MPGPGEHRARRAGANLPPDDRRRRIRGVTSSDTAPTRTAAGSAPSAFPARFVLGVAALFLAVGTLLYLGAVSRLLWPEVAKHHIWTTDKKSSAPVYAFNRIDTGLDVGYQAAHRSGAVGVGLVCRDDR